MTLFSSIILGFIQGLTEFLPISSSGHLAIAEHIMDAVGSLSVPPFFDVLLHLGTLIAVFVAYWAEIREMIFELFRGIGDLARGTTPRPMPAARRMILLIIVGTLPLFAVLPIKDKVEALSGSLLFVGGALLATGVLLFVSDRVRRGSRDEDTASFLSVLVVGLGQAVATCPGISRSGTTITMGCLAGFDRRFAVRYSFLMSIPAILGANILSIKDTLEAGGIPWGEVPVYLVGVAVAAVVGYACIRLLKMIADKGRFGWFAYYCWAVGALTLVMAMMGK